MAEAGSRFSRLFSTISMTRKPRFRDDGQAEYLRRRQGPGIEQKPLFTTKSLYGRPLEEVDSFVFEDTFCVLSRKFGRNYIYRFSATRALYLLGPLNYLRQICVFLITHPYYDLFIIFVIFANSIALAFDSNQLERKESEEDYHTKDHKLPRPVELAFLTIYTAEMLLKVIAKGFVFHKFSYLRNGWNILDFVVVISGIATELVELFGNADSDKKKKLDLDLEVFRTFRVLRVIKTISILPGLRLMINALANAVVQLLEVMALTLFCLCIFSLFAMEIYSGKLHQVCVLMKGTNTAKILYQSPDMTVLDGTAPDIRHEYRSWVTNKFNWFERDFPDKEYMPCSNDSGGRICPADYLCLPDLNENPDFGWTSFDNFGMSMLSTFQLLTLDFWERLFDLIVSTVGPISIPFFIMVVFLGAFYLLNLMLAVVAMSYEQEAHSWEKKPLTKHQKLTLHRTDSTFSFDDPTRLNVAIMTHFKRRTPSEREMLGRAFRNNSESNEEDIERTRQNFTTAIMDILGKRLNAPPEQPVQAPLLPPPASLTFTNREPVPEVKEPKIPPRLRAEVLGSTHLFIEASDMAVIRRLAEQLITENSQEPPVPVVPTPKASKTITFMEKCARYNNDSESDSAVSVLSTDIMDDPDQYSTSSVNIETDKGRALQRRTGLVHRGLKILKRYLAVYVSNIYFESFITICIILNTVLLASEHHNQPPWLTDIISAGGYMFTLIFTFECVLKIIVLQADYFSQNWNRFDLIVVCISFADALADTGLPGGNAIRSFRLLRIFKLAHSWITMKILLNIIFSTFGALGNLTFILGIVIYIFAILGMNLVGKEYTPMNFDVSELDDVGFPRWNFQNFWYSFMMVFRVMCGEWIEPLWDCLVAHEESGSYWRCFIIFLPILIIGNFIVLNLFLALLLNSFDSEEIKAQREKEQGSTSHRHGSLNQVVDLLLNKRPSIPEIPEAPPEPEPEEEDENAENKPRKIIPGRFKKLAKKIIIQNRKAAAERAILRAEGTNEYAEARFQKNPLITAKRSSFMAGGGTPSEGSVILKETRARREPDPCFPPKCFKNKLMSRFMTRRTKFQRWEGLRKCCLTIVSAPIFEWVILVLIAASSITLCFEDVHLDKNADLTYTLFMLNCTFTGLFTVEMILKWLGLGFHKYFTTFWTLLDIFVVMISIISLAFDIENESWKIPDESMTARRKRSGLGGLKALRTLRALRPLRAISRWQGMKVVVNALLYAIPSIFNVLLVCLLFWLVFAIMGVNFFKGKFFQCIYNENGSRVHHSIIATKSQCCARDDISWVNTSPNFDSVFEGYLSLFQVATFEGWIELMRAATDVDDVDKQSIRDNNFAAYAFFVVFIVFGSFFTLQLFIGVIIDNFNMLKKKYEGNLLEFFLTPSQKRYYTTMKKLGRKKPRRIVRRPLNRCLAVFYDIAMSRRFEISIFVLIFGNMVLMAMEQYKSRMVYTNILSGFNSFFSGLYIVEAVIKILGLKENYFKIPWNIFDLVLVILSLTDMFLADSTALPFPPTLLRVVRVFRIGRVLRLIKAAKGIRKLLFALIVSLPALFNIGALLFLIVFIYAILGMALFKDAALNTALDENWSFQTFPQSAMLLFRLMTAAGWNEVLDALSVEYAVCGYYRKIKCGRKDSDEPECISRFQATVYMVTFLIITYLIVINMYVAVILENYEEASHDEDIGIVEDDLEMFYVRWSRYDPAATQFILFDQLSEFLNNLDPPLHVPKPNIVAIVSFNLPIARGNRIHCLDILHALIKHVLGRVEDTEEFRKVQEQMEQKFRKQFPSRKLLDIVSSTRAWKIQHNAAMIIQRAWKSYQRRKYPPREKTKSTLTLRSIESAMSARRGNVFRRMNNFFRHPRKRKSSLKQEFATRRRSMFADDNKTIDETIDRSVRDHKT